VQPPPQQPPGQLSGPSGSTPERLRALREQYDGAVGAWLGGAREVVLLDYPDHDNVGDSLIWVGLRDSLDRLGVTVALAAAQEHTAVDHVRRLTGVPVLFHGGGNFGDLWGHTHAVRLEIIRSLPDRRILVLPQSVHFGAPGADRETIDVLRAHPDITLLVRDRPSLAWATQAGLTAALVPDAALAVDPRRVPAVPRTDRPTHAVALWRTDKEVAAGASLGPAGSLVRVDWPVEHDRLRLPLRLALRVGTLPIGRPAPARRLVVAACDAMARREVRRGLALLGDAPVLVTDRLHAAVLGLLSGRQVCRVDNSYGKLGAVLDQWWPDDPRMTSVATRAEAEAWARELTGSRTP